MPRKPKSRSRSRRSKVAWRVRGSNPTGRVTKNVKQTMSKSIGLPACMNIKLRYVDQKVVVSSTPYYQFIYALNNLYDPEQPLGGHQPMYYDAFAGMYNEYLVTGCKVSITVTQDNQQDSPLTFFWGVKDTVSVSPNPTIVNCMEQGDRSMFQLGFAGAGSATKTLTQYTDIAKVHGIRGGLTPRNIPFTSVVNTGPDEGVYGIMQIFSTNGVARVNCMFTITLDYTCCFFNRKQVEAN